MLDDEGGGAELAADLEDQRAERLGLALGDAGGTGGDAGGSVQAYDAKTGDLLWEFQTGLRGARGPAMSYEVDREQYVAVATGTALWSFKLGGSLPPRPALPPVTPSTATLPPRPRQPDLRGGGLRS